MHSGVAHLRCEGSDWGPPHVELPILTGEEGEDQGGRGTGLGLRGSLRAKEGCSPARTGGRQSLGAPFKEGPRASSLD